MEAGATPFSPLVPGAPAPGTGRSVVLTASSRRTGERLIKAGLFGAAVLSILTTVAIVLSLLGETIRFFREVGIVDFLTGTEWSPLFANPSFGVLPLVVGTLLISAIALAVAVPLGLGAAVYLSEYARPRTRRVLKPILELLAGVPTVVLGYFALTYFTPVVLRDLLGLDVSIYNALAGGIVVGVMVIPTIASVAEDAMTAVPAALREGAYGLGATRRQVSSRVVFPAALSGIVAAVVLGASRAIGETMVVLVAAGQVPSNSPDSRLPHETMAAFIGATGKGDAATGSIAYKTIFAVGMTLFVITLILNIISIRFVRRFRQVYE
jgi:phosphate transport system permease protein